MTCVACDEEFARGRGPGGTVGRCVQPHQLPLVDGPQSAGGCGAGRILGGRRGVGVAQDGDEFLEEGVPAGEDLLDLLRGGLRFGYFGGEVVRAEHHDVVHGGFPICVGVGGDGVADAVGLGTDPEVDGGVLDEREELFAVWVVGGDVVYVEGYSVG